MNDQTIYKQKYFFYGFWYSGFHWLYFFFLKKKNVVRQHIFEMRKENLLLLSLSLWCLLCQVQCVIYLPFMKNDRDDFQRNFMNLMKPAWLYIIYNVMLLSQFCWYFGKLSLHWKLTKLICIFGWYPKKEGIVHCILFILPFSSLGL